MKYFTKELWAGFNQDLNDEKRYKSLSKKWNKNLESYWDYIKSIEPKLKGHAKRFFPKMSLHDGTLKQFSIGDILPKKGHRASSVGTYAEFQILLPDSDKLVILKYKNIRKCNIDYPSDFPLFLNDNNSFGDWGYDEFKLLDDSWMQHEILFSTGMVIIMEFKKFTYNKYKIDKK